MTARKPSTGTTRDTRDHAVLAATLLRLELAGRAIEVLAEAGVPVVALKGIALVDTVYAADSRPMSDIDLLVPPGQFAEAHRALVRAGYRWAEPHKEWRSRQSFHERHYLDPGSGMLDLHAHLDEPYRWCIDDADLFARAVPIEIAGRAAHRLGNEDLLLHLAIHMVKDDLALANQTPWDIAAVIERLGVDWQVFLGRARAWQCATAVWLSLSHAAKVAGASVPDRVLRATRPSAARRLYLSAFFDPEQTPPFRFPSWYRRRQVAVRWWLLDGWGSRLRDVAHVAGRQLEPLFAAATRSSDT